MGKPLPLILSIPHGGMHVPKELTDSYLPSLQETLTDGDLWTRYLFNFGDFIAHTVAADIPRLIVDLNRDKSDFRPDGVVKQITLRLNPVWKTFPHGDALKHLLQTYYDPYYDKLHHATNDQNVKIGIDCHSMLPSDPFDKNALKRPLFCLSNRGNASGEYEGEPLSCPAELLVDFKEILEESFGKDTVLLNAPFQGGQIIKTMGGLRNIPWFQLEINRKLYEPDRKAKPVQPTATERRKLDALKGKLFHCLSNIAFENPLYSTALHTEKPLKKPIIP